MRRWIPPLFAIVTLSLLCLAAPGIAGEECILPRQGHRFHRPLDGVGVHLAPTVRQEGRQSVPSVESVSPAACGPGPGMWLVGRSPR